MTQSKVFECLFQYAISDFNVMGSLDINYLLELKMDETSFYFYSKEVRLEIVEGFIKANSIMPCGTRYEYIRIGKMERMSLQSGEWNEKEQDIDNVRKQHKGQLLVYNIEEIK